MPEQWLKEIHGFKVERKEIHRPGRKPYYAMNPTRRGVLHTTEGSTVEGAYVTLAKSNSAPHFITGQGRIVQCRPIGVQAAALHNPMNRDVYIQIEMVGKTQLKPWLPVEATLRPTLAIMAYAAEHLGIPLRVPCSWKDDCSDCRLPWAANNSRRRTAMKGAWNTEMGWWMHMEVPNQGPSWHYDCGALRRSEMVQMAQSLIVPKVS